jgi:hypothetical protein
MQMVVHPELFVQVVPMGVAVVAVVAVTVLEVGNSGFGSEGCRMGLVEGE